MRWWPFVVLAGCGRVDFDARARDAQTLETACWPRWFSSDLAFDTPRQLTELPAGTVEQADASLARSDLELYFSRTESPSAIYVATRAARGLPWENPTRVGDLDAGGDAYRVTIADDDRTAVFNSLRSGTLDLYGATRSGSSFGAIGTTDVAVLDTNGQEKYPELAADGLGIYFVRVAAMRTELHATRATLDDPFGAPTELSELGISGLIGVGDASVSPDERVITYIAGSGPYVPYYATRANKTDTFSAGRPIPGLSSPRGELDTELSSDGCEVYFSSYRDRITLTDLYVATQAP